MSFKTKNDRSISESQRQIYEQFIFKKFIVVVLSFAWLFKPAVTSIPKLQTIYFGHSKFMTQIPIIIRNARLMATHCIILHGYTYMYRFFVTHNVNRITPQFNFEKLLDIFNISFNGLIHLGLCRPDTLYFITAEQRFPLRT